MIRQKIVEEALSWIGTPYKRFCWHKGRGADCAMMVQEIFRTAGLLKDRFEVSPFDTDWMIHGTREILLARIQEVLDREGLVKYSIVEYEDAKPLEPGDILMFSLYKTRLSHHIGIYIGDNAMVHCINRGVQRQPLVQMWEKRIMKVIKWEQD